MQPIRNQNRFLSTRDLTLSAAFAAVYIVSTFIPVSVFIGGAGFITLEIVMVPVIAAILWPLPATITIIVGSLGTALFGTGVYPVFGFFGLLVPVIATVLGSLAFHHRLGALFPWGYVLLGAVYYIAFSKGGTPLWLAPYAIVVFSLPITLKATGTRLIVFLSLYTAMSWQVTLNVLSISVAGLLDGFWTGVTPLMFFERTVATAGGSAVIIALKSRLYTSLGISQELVRR